MARPTVSVRRACADDVDDLLLLWGQARDELGRTVRSLSGTSVEQMRPRLAEALAGGSVNVLLAHEGGAPAGYALVTVSAVNPLLDGLFLTVEHLYVGTAQRHRGVAKALLGRVAGLAESLGCEQVISNVAPTSRESHRFLARLGFTPLIVKRVVPTATLRRRLAGQARRGGLEDLLSRRRSQRARFSRVAWAEVAPEDCTSEPRGGEADPLRVIDLTRLDARLDARPDRAAPRAAQA